MKKVTMTRKALAILVIVLVALTAAVLIYTMPKEGGAITTSGEASQAISEVGEGVSNVGSILEDIDRKLS